MQLCSPMSFCCCISTKTVSSMAVLLIIILWLSIEETQARPNFGGPAMDSKQDLRDCEVNAELMELCQRCAKATKSPEAYPSCCSPVDIPARNWCRDYIYFGLQ